MFVLVCGSLPRAAQSNKGLANTPLEKETSPMDPDFTGGEQSVQKLSDMRLSKEDREFLDLPEVEDDL